VGRANYLASIKGQGLQRQAERIRSLEVDHKLELDCRLSARSRALR
jgi:hypothetical protein